MLVSSLIPQEETGRPTLIATKSYVYPWQYINNKLEEGKALHAGWGGREAGEKRERADQEADVQFS